MAEELFGLSSTEAIGRGCHEILQGNDVRQPTTLELLDKSRSLCAISSFSLAQLILILNFLTSDDTFNLAVEASAAKCNC